MLHNAAAVRSAPCYQLASKATQFNALRDFNYTSLCRGHYVPINCQCVREVDLNSGKEIQRDDCYCTAIPLDYGPL